MSRKGQTPETCIEVLGIGPGRHMLGLGMDTATDVGVGLGYLQ